MTQEGTADSSSASAPRVPSSFVKVGDRMRFTVELRAGETTIVSWKKLMKDASKAETAGTPSTSAAAVAATAASAAAVSPPEVPAVAVPAVEPRLSPGQPDANPNEDANAPHRFSAVIEKIERLYMGKDSSDEEDLNDIPDDDQYDTEDSFIDDAELDEYFQVDKSKTKHDGYFVNRGTLEKVGDPPEPAFQPQNRGKRKEMIKGAGNDDCQRPSKHMKPGKKGTGKYLSAEKLVSPMSEGPSVTKSMETKFQTHQKIAVDGKPFLDQSLRIHHNEEASGNGDRVESMHKSHSVINSFEESKLVMQQKDKSTMRESIDLNLPDTKHSIQHVKNSAVHKKEGSSAKPKFNVLEKAIRELEKMVAESRPPAPDAQDGDSSSQYVKRRLPREIKQKLAKVARLAHASNDKVSKELLSRLMGIVGHLCQVRTLKRHLKVMVTTSLSAKQEKDDKFQVIKKEVVDMVKAHVPSLMSKLTEQQNGASGELQASGHLEVAKGLHFMDSILEDKICDLYDTFVDGLDEDVGPQVRKLYAELAELWPKGVMDNHGIKRAICRAKERRRILTEKNKDQEKIRRRKAVSTNTEDTVRLESNLAAQSHCADPNPSVQTQHNCFPTSFGAGNVIIPATTTSTAFTSSSNVPSLSDRPRQEKVKVMHNSSSFSDARIVNGFHMNVKKKAKKRAESLVGEDHMRAEQLLSHQYKHPAESLQGGPHKSSSVGFRFEPLM